MFVVAAMYKRRTSPSSGAVRTSGEVRKSLSSRNALEASSFHSNLSDFRKRLKKGRPLSLSQLKNLLKAAMHPVSFIKSFFLLGGFMNLMALSSFPDGTPNTLGRVEFPFKFPEIFKSLREIRNELIITFFLDDDIIDVGLGVAPDLPLEASLNGLRVGGAGILEAERHGLVAVGPEGGDEGGLLLIRLL